MIRLYIIITTILVVLGMWVNSSSANLLPIKNKAKVTNAMVEEKMTPYIQCMNMEMVLIKEAFNGPMKNKTASANTIRIVKGCDGHLKHIMKWLNRMEEPNGRINKWAKRMRQQYLNKVFEYLNTGMIANKEHKEGSSHKHE